MSAPVITRERAEAQALASEHEDLLVLLTTLRAASGDALVTLYFAPRAVPRRTAYRRLKTLVEHALLARQPIAERRTVYRLAGAALTLSPRVALRVSDAARKPLGDDEAGYGWLRASVWAELTKLGFEVGRGLDELLALRRFLVDAQVNRCGDHHAASRVLSALRSDPTLTPLFRSRCARCRWEGALRTPAPECPACRGKTEQAVAQRRFECVKCGHASDRPEPHDVDMKLRRACAGKMREADHLPLDVAWRTSRGTREVMIVFIDDPGRDLAEQLRALPLRVSGQPRLPILLRTTDLGSVYSREERAWTSQGERHRALLRAFSESGDKRAFPFATTADVVELFPELQLRLSHSHPRKAPTHA